MIEHIQKITPAHLWIGSPIELHAKTVKFLQTKFCKTACGSCIQCIQIAQQQHHASVWLTPEKQYTLDQLDVIFSTISFMLEENQQHFFILQHADFLTPTCANALLKVLEEPPAGYHFILLAQQQERILPTIRSRCIIKNYVQKEISINDPLFMHFTSLESIDAQQFLHDLEKAKPTERSSIEWLDALLAFWIHMYKKACINQDTLAQDTSARIINTLCSAYKRLPMPGSAKLFLKNLFLLIKTPLA